eukprot:3294860-Rhodomonas_salina.1
MVQRSGVLCADLGCDDPGASRLATAGSVGGGGGQLRPGSRPVRGTRIPWNAPWDMHAFNGMRVSHSLFRTSRRAVCLTLIPTVSWTVLSLRVLHARSPTRCA